MPTGPRPATLSDVATGQLTGAGVSPFTPMGATPDKRVGTVPPLGTVGADVSAYGGPTQQPWIAGAAPLDWSAILSAPGDLMRYGRGQSEVGSVAPGLIPGANPGPETRNLNDRTQSVWDFFHGPLSGIAGVAQPFVNGLRYAGDNVLPGLGTANIFADDGWYGRGQDLFGAGLGGGITASPDALRSAAYRAEMAAQPGGVETLFDRATGAGTWQRDPFTGAVTPGGGFDPGGDGIITYEGGGSSDIGDRGTGVMYDPFTGTVLDPNAVNPYDQYDTSNPFYNGPTGYIPLDPWGPAPANPVVTKPKPKPTPAAPILSLDDIFGTPDPIAPATSISAGSSPVSGRGFRQNVAIPGF